MLNEADNIVGLLQHLLSNSSPKNIKEVLIIDGGSTDGSQEIADHFIKSNEVGINCPNIKLIKSSRGRAKQMNIGAENAKGEVLYFLHADSLPPSDFCQAILDEIENGADAGCFRMKFDNDDHLVLKLSQWFTRFNLRGCRGGDQSLFITKQLFGLLNGFNEEYIIYEDSEFISRIYDQGGFAVIPDYVTTSSRRYDENGTWKLQYHFTVIHLKKFFGASPNRLYEYYIRNIAS